MRSEYTPCLLPIHLTNITIPRLNKLLGDVVISQGGVVPHIDAAVRFHLIPVRNMASNIHFFVAPAQQDAEGQEGVAGGLDFFLSGCCTIYVLSRIPIILLYYCFPHFT